MKANKLGLVLVFASLIAIAVIVSVIFEHQYANRLSIIRSQGFSLARTLSAVPYENLAPQGSQVGVMQLLRQGHLGGDFAYVRVVDANDVPTNEVVADGIVVPMARMPVEPTAWSGEKTMSLAAGGRLVIEFYAPLLDKSELRGFVRLGFFYPEYGISEDQIPFLATVALVVFLLVPLFYVLLRFEIRPLRKANDAISRMMEGESFRRVELAATGELGEFMQRFNLFVERSNATIASLQGDQKRLITSSKLLTYKKSRIETVLETLPEAVLILDESGSATFANKKTSAMFNAPIDTILSEPPHDWCDSPEILQLLERHQATANARSLTDTIRFKVSSASNRAIATNAYPLFSPKNPKKAIGTLIVFRDETQEALARQARADFVGHLSHELKSPLNVLALYSESLSSEAGKEEDFRIEATNVISFEVSRLNALITGLLNITQIETGSLSPDRSLVRLRDVAEAALEDARRASVATDMSFEFDAPKDMSPVFVDKDLIRIAIDNLLNNAIKYNSEDGTVRILVAETNDAIQIRVADSGIGISEEDESRIFQKFFRSDDLRVQEIGGHGLGLALSKQIIELHQGTLTLDRSRRSGSEFIINLWKETTAIKQAI